MLSDHAIHPTLPAQDMERARRFYEDKLGMEVESEDPGGVFYRSGTTRFLVFPSGGRPSGTHTQVGWQVDNVEAEVAALKARGVEFETYDFDGFDPQTSIATTGRVKAAWFKDSEGNLLGVAQLS